MTITAIKSRHIRDATTAGKALLTAADKAAQRTALELGTAAQSSTSDFAAASHTHDDRYYTEAEIASLLSSYVTASAAASTYLSLSGGTLTGKLTCAAGGPSAAAVCIPQGVAPTSPTDGDVWWASGTAVHMRLLGNTYQFPFLSRTSTWTAQQTFSTAPVFSSGFKVTRRVTSATSSATPTPSADTDDIYSLTALATNPTFGAPTGSPTDGQQLLIRVKDDGTSRTLSWNASYRSAAATLPTATTVNKTLYVQFLYHSADAKWDCMATGSVA